MRTARTSAWRSALAALAAVVWLGCREEIAAPGQCPELCPSADVELVDTTLTDVVASDSSLRGFVSPIEAAVLVASSLDSLKSLALVRFVGVDTVFLRSGDTTRYRIGGFDSVVVEVTLLQRDTAVRDLRVLVVRLPVGIDSTATYAGALPLFDDSLIVDSIVVDSVLGDSVAGGLLRKALPTAQVTPAPGDSGRLALGIAVRAATPTAVTFGAGDFSGVPPRLTWYARAESPNDTIAQPLSRLPDFDTFVQDPVPGAPPAGVLAVGNLPSARAILRLAIPEVLLDSTTIVRGTLVLTLTRPVTGRPGETFDVEARPVIRDFGPKSLTVGNAPADSVLLGRGSVTVGQTGTVELEVGRMLRLWRGAAADSLPRMVVLRSRLEGGGIGEIQFARAGTGAGAPALRLTFVRPYRFGVP